MQIAAGAKGITCQKLGEAEVMADGGQDDILISYNILGEEKLGRLGKLAGRVKMTVSADNPGRGRGIAAAPPRSPDARSTCSSNATPDGRARAW